MMQSFLIYEEARKYLVLYEEADSHVRQCTRSLPYFPILLNSMQALWKRLNENAGGRILGRYSDKILKVPKCENFHRTDFFFFLP